MKQLFICVALIALFSCTRQNLKEPFSGTWTIVETNSAENGFIQLQTYPPSSEVTLKFAGNGTLVRTGTNPGTAKSPLWEYDKYQVLEENIIRFYQSAGSKEMRALYTVDGNLVLNYLAMRHGYEETFLKIK